VENDMSDKKRTYEEKVAEFNAYKEKHGYVPYHVHKAIFADPMSWKVFWLVHGGMFLLIGLAMLFGAK